MDPRRFDALSRSLAAGTLTRRGALARLGAGGLAALAGVAGRDRLRAAPAAQTGATCALAIVATARLGPSAAATLGGSAPGELRGDLSFGLDDDGALTDATLRLAGGTELPVVGQATGRALHLRLAAGLGQVLVLVGTAENDVRDCAGAADGLLTGPQAGDLGDWHAVAGPLDGGASAAPSAAASVAASAAPATGASARSSASASPRPSSGASASPSPSGSASPSPSSSPSPLPSTPSLPGPPPPCAQTGAPCGAGGCCVGFCNQDGLCDCVSDGNPCAQTGTGGCCTGAPCSAAGYCGACTALGAGCAGDAECCVGFCAEGNVCFCFGAGEPCNPNFANGGCCQFCADSGLCG